jgi:hypothetical protein
MHMFYNRKINQLISVASIEAKKKFQYLKHLLKRQQ